MIKGVIFDLDGVLVSTDEMHYQAWKRLADQLGIFGFTRKDNERQRGVSRMASLEIVLEKTDRVYTEEEKVKLAEKKNDYYKEINKLIQNQMFNYIEPRHGINIINIIWKITNSINE